MKKYTYIIKNNEIIFKDLLDNSELKIKRYEDEYVFDTIFISRKYKLDFINYVIKTLKISKDIASLLANYDSPKLEKLLYKNGLRISNYQYTIYYKEVQNLKLNDYEISNILDKEGKNFYLELINKLLCFNQQYINPEQKNELFSEAWFKNGDYEYRVYRKMGKVVGIVDYKNFEYSFDYSQNSKEYFDYNNKLCVRLLLSEEKLILEDILKDLLNTYKKDIVINITYSEKILKNVIKKMNGKFDFCQYILVDKDNKQ